MQLCVGSAKERRLPGSTVMTELLQQSAAVPRRGLRHPECPEQRYGGDCFRLDSTLMMDSESTGTPWQYPGYCPGRCQESPPGVTAPETAPAVPNTAPPRAVNCLPGVPRGGSRHVPGRCPGRKAPGRAAQARGKRLVVSA